MKYYYSYVRENNYFKYNEQIKGINMNKQRYLKKSISVLVFTIPALIPLFVFWVYPICRSVWISFTDWDYMTPTYHFVFLKNYISLFKDTRFYEALLNTLITDSIAVCELLIHSKPGNPKKDNTKFARPLSG